MTFGERLKQRRKEIGISAEELAKRIGKNRATIYRYEKGDIENIPIDVLEPLAKALQTTPQYLMGWDESTDSNMVGEIIRSIREKKHISAEEFANDVGINISDLRNYESNIKPIPEKMLKFFADYLKVPIEALKGTTVGFSNAGSFYIAKNPNILKTNARWYSIFGDLEFTTEEHNKMIEYANFLLYQREENNK